MTPTPTATTPDLGSCCICAGKQSVRTVLQLGFRAPVPGTGWGCVVCRLPGDGAVAVLCDECCKKHQKTPELLHIVKTICHGFPGQDVREALNPDTHGAPANVFQHVIACHSETWACRRCHCTDRTPCLLSGEPCHWIAKDLCSSCATAEQLAAYDAEEIEFKRRLDRRNFWEVMQWVHDRKPEVKAP